MSLIPPTGSASGVLSNTTGPVTEDNARLAAQTAKPVTSTSATTPVSALLRVNPSHQQALPTGQQVVLAPVIASTALTQESNMPAGGHLNQTPTAQGKTPGALLEANRATGQQPLDRPNTTAAQQLTQAALERASPASMGSQQQPVAAKSWLLTLQLPGVSGASGGSLQAISDTPYPPQALLALRAHPTAQHAREPTADSGNGITGRLLATAVTAQVKIDVSAEAMSTLRPLGNLVAAKVMTVKAVSIEQPPANPSGSANSITARTSAPTAAPAGNGQAAAFEQASLAQKQQLPSTVSGRIVEVIPVNSALNAVAKPAASNAAAGLQAPQRAPAWQVDLQLTDQTGNRRELQLLAAHPLDKGSTVALSIAATSEKNNAQSALSEIAAIINKSLPAINQEARPLTDLTRLHQTLARSEHGGRSLGVESLHGLQKIAEFGVTKSSDIKELVKLVGVFSQASSSPPESAASKPGPALSSVASSELPPSINGVKAMDSTARNQPEPTIKEQIMTLLAQLPAVSSAPGNNPSAAANRADPLLLLMELLAKPIAGAGSAGNQPNQQADSIKQLTAKVLQQVLLGIQAASLKNLAEGNLIADRDSQYSQAVNIELPMHWSNNSTGKLHLRIDSRESWQENHRRDEAETGKSWQFELTMDFPGDRVMTTRCALNQQRARLQIWANRADFKATIEQHLQGLKSKMEHDGIALDYCGCALGTAPANGRPGSYQQLINTRA